MYEIQCPFWSHVHSTIEYRTMMQQTHSMGRLYWGKIVSPTSRYIHIQVLLHCTTSTGHWTLDIEYCLDFSYATNPICRFNGFFGHHLHINHLFVYFKSNLDFSGKNRFRLWNCKCKWNENFPLCTSLRRYMLWIYTSRWVDALSLFPSFSLSLHLVFHSYSSPDSVSIHLSGF